MTISYIGSTISVVAATPVSEDQTGYELLTFVPIGKIVSAGELGDEHEDITSNLLATGRTEHSNGTADGGESVITYEYDSSDAGQVIIKAGNGTNANHSFRITDTDGEDSYFQGIVANMKQRERTTSNKKGGTFVARINTAITVV